MKNHRNFDWAKCQSIYEEHLNDSYIEEEKQYTFFADMVQFLNTYTGESLINEFENYIDDALNNNCKGNRNAYCAIIVSLRQLLWVLILTLEEKHAAIWCGEKIRNLYHNEEIFLKYVTKEEMNSIYAELD